ILRKKQRFSASTRKPPFKRWTARSPNGGFLVDAENRCFFRRMQVQTKNVFSLGLKIRIGAGHVVLQAVRLQPDLVPDPHDREVAYAPTSRQTPRGPVRDRSRR